MLSNCSAKQWIRHVAVIIMVTLTAGVADSQAAANTTPYDTTRIYQAMAKARRGEPVTVGVIGGSITDGYAASSDANKWANLVADWWESTFPASNVTLVNAGIGGTGSDIGTHRIQTDLLDYDPDFIVVEFSVNDTDVEQPTTMMEGLVQQVLTHDSLPGIMLLLLKMQDGGTAQDLHKPVGDHYAVPMISFADQIDTAASNDGYTLEDVYLDGVHPVDLGMAYIAEFITRELEIIYSNLPDDENLPEISTVMPAPLVGETYSHCYMYSPADLVPLMNSGWEVNTLNWEGENPGQEISFTIDGNAISILYNKHNNGGWGQVEAWVDNGDPVIVDAFWTQTWGPAIKFATIAEELEDGEHTLHIRVRAENTGGGDGNFFRVLNILKAGTFEGVAPIADAGPNVKSLINTSVTLEGTNSFDPGGLDLTSVAWSIVYQPAGSVSTIEDPASLTTEFTPDIEGVYKIGLSVTNQHYTSVVSMKNVNVVSSNTAPEASPGDDLTVGTKAYYTLDGSASSDADGDELSFRWRVITEPVDNSLRLYESNTATPRIYATEEGEYTLGLIVNDSIADSEESVITITAIEGYTALRAVSSTQASMQVYPNPATDKLNIQYIIQQSSPVTIELFGLDGTLIAVIKDSAHLSGEYNIETDLDRFQLQPGNYFIRLRNNDEILVVQFTRK